jgi:hypothetical protein
MAGRDPVLVIGAFAALRLAWGFCWCWFERSRRKTMLAVLDKLLAWERERNKRPGRRFERGRPPPPGAS